MADMTNEKVLEKAQEIIKNDNHQKNKKNLSFFSRLWIVKRFKWEVSSIYFSILDIKNFLSFRKIMKRLSKDPNSKFSKMNLHLNKLGNIVYSSILLDKEHALYPDVQKVSFIKNFTYPAHKYLFDELLWGEYLVTEIQEFSDMNGNKSSYYGITYTFKPIAINNKKLYWQLLWWLLALFFIVKLFIIYLLPIILKIL